MFQKEGHYGKTLEIVIHNLWRKINCPLTVYDIGKVPGEKCHHIHSKVICYLLILCTITVSDKNT